MIQLTVGEIMEIGYFKFSCLLTGEVGLSNKVSCVTIMDELHITGWLRGNELLISGNYLEQSFTKKFIADLVAAKCSGIITKEKFTLNLDPKLVKLCQELTLPIIIVPDHCSWGDMMNPVNNAIIKKQYESIEDTNRFHNTLIKAFIQKNSLPDLCSNMIEVIGVTAAISTSNFSFLAGSSDFNWQSFIKTRKTESNNPVSIIAHNSDEYMIKGTIIENKSLIKIGKKIFIYPIKENSELFGYFFILKERYVELIPKNEIVKIQFSGLLFALKVSQQREMEISTKYYNSFILDDILSTDNIAANDIRKYATALGKNIASHYRILILSYQDSKNNTHIEGEILGQIRTNLLRENHVFEQLLLFEHKQKIVIFLPSIDEKTIKETTKEMLSSIGKIFDNIKISICAGLSKLHSFENSKIGYREAKQALYSAIERRLYNTCVYYEDLGVLRFLSDNHGKINETYITELLERYIFPLKKYDDERKTNLLYTLKTFVNYDLSSIKTAQSLFIHKNTLRARLKTIEKILDCPLSGNFFFDLQLALKVYEFHST